MKFVICIICLSGMLYSCHNRAEQPVANESEKLFDKAKWKIKDGKDYPYRDKMLYDLIANVKLKGIRYDDVMDLLGQPDRIDSSYLFYSVAQQRLGFFPLHTKSFVVKLAKDSTVEWRKIHE